MLGDIYSAEYTLAGVVVYDFGFKLSGCRRDSRYCVAVMLFFVGGGRAERPGSEGVELLESCHR